jgi:outer membrane protein OmpA-like peptidoglycan-associated protein
LVVTAALGAGSIRAHAAECDAAVVDVTPSRAREGKPVIPPDVYIAPRVPLEAGLGSVFKVFRPGAVRSDDLRTYPLYHYIGRLQIIDVQRHILVGRMIELAPRQQFPRPRYDTVMLGDCLELEPPEESASEALSILSRAHGARGPDTMGAESMPLPEVGTLAGAAIPETYDITAARATPSVILFRFDKSEVDEQWYRNLEQIARFISIRKPAKVVVEGHADWIGTDEYNLGLSQRRARAMVDHLVRRYGLARELFILEAHGESDPAASNMTADGRRLNRRAAASVLFKIYPATESGPDSSAD